MGGYDDLTVFTLHLAGEDLVSRHGEFVVEGLAGRNDLAA
jgi:hypothetical protein